MTAITQLSAVTIPLTGDELLTFVDTYAPAGQKNKKGALSSVRDYVLSGVTSGSNIVTSSVTINVPADYADLKPAIDAYLDKYCAAGAVVNCVIASGHTVTAQVGLTDADMPWFIVSSPAASVPVDTTGWVANPLTGMKSLFTGLSSRMPDVRCSFTSNDSATEICFVDLVGSDMECLSISTTTGAYGFGTVGLVQFSSLFSALSFGSDGGNLSAFSDATVNMQMLFGSQIHLGTVEAQSGSDINIQDESSAAPNIIIDNVDCTGSVVTINGCAPSGAATGAIFRCDNAGEINITNGLNHASGVTVDTMFSVSGGSVIKCASIGSGWAGNYSTWASPSLNTVSSDGLIMAPAAP